MRTVRPAPDTFIFNSSQMSAASPFVRFDHVSYAPPGAARPIISDLNLEIFRGETLVLLGESGCGKTTTLRLVNRMLLPTTGRVLVAGQPTSAGGALVLRRSMGSG